MGAEKISGGKIDEKFCRHKHKNRKKGLDESEFVCYNNPVTEMQVWRNWQTR